MSRRYSTEDVYDTIMSEGLGYSIEHHIAFHEIDDAELSRLWQQAEKSLSDIQIFFGENNTSED